MREILRHMARRKSRTALTMLGIVIGMLAVTVMGSLSEYLSLTAARLNQVTETRFDIRAKSDGPPLGMRVVEQARRIPGVVDAVPSMYAGLDPEDENATQSIPIIGFAPEALPRLFAWPGLQEGRWLTDLDTDAAVVTFNYAVQNGVKVGDTIRGKDRKLQVVGQLGTTGFGLGDNAVVVSLETARRIARAPYAMSGITVLVSGQAQGDAVAAQVAEAIPDVEVKSPSQAKKELGDGLVTFYAIIWTGAIIATIVGALSVTNTMFMAVAERTREIGLKKALGARDGALLREFMVEAVTVSLVGGITGIVLGWSIAAAINAAAGPAAGLQFVVTSRLLVFGLMFSSAIGLLAGLAPAWNATRLDPVAALRL